MESTQALEGLLTDSLLSRNLPRIGDGRLAFVHNGNAIELTVEATTYRGHVITVLGHRRNFEFRTQPGGFNWDAIAASIVDKARRCAPLAADTSLSLLATELSSQTSSRRCDEHADVHVVWRQFERNPVASLPFNDGASRVLPEAQSDGPSGQPWTGTNTLPIELSRVLPIDDLRRP
jgi:hypothetical protein